MMLAGISTLAGNLFIISAASNVIVVQQAEKFGQKPFTFWQFTFARAADHDRFGRADLRLDRLAGARLLRRKAQPARVSTPR